MKRMVWCGALALALLSAARTSAAETVDCWLLDGSRLEQVRQQGLCLDAFGRNAESVPPEPAKRTAQAKGNGRHATAAHPMRVPGPRPEAKPPQPAVPADAATDRPRPPPGNPAAAALHGLQEDWAYFLDDVQRDFRTIGSFLLRAGRSHSSSDFQVSER